MIDVSDILEDPDLCQDFTVYRSSGAFAAGGWVEGEPAQVPFSGVITVASAKELAQVPEGDRVQGSMAFRSSQPIYVTRNGEFKGTSDRIMWRGEPYRVVQVLPYADYGYWKAIGARMEGD